MKRPDAICVADRFPELRVHLLELLSSLAEEDWNKPTAAPLWTVKDVAAHLLGGDIGNLSRRRDAYQPAGKSIGSYEDLVAFINQLNADWVQAARRMSPRVLCELLAFTGPPMERYFASLDPFAVGGPVNWAGPGPAPVWLDVAREFTERWHHQQQIRDATRREPLYARHLFGPVLDAFVRAVPHSYRNTPAKEGTLVRLEISGAAGGVWWVRRGPEEWELFVEADGAPAAGAVLPQDAAWRLFTKGIDGERARSLSVVTGDRALLAPLFGTIAVLA